MKRHEDWRQPILMCMDRFGIEVEILAYDSDFGAASFGTAITNPLWVYSAP